MVPLKIVSNVSRIKPALNLNRVLADLNRRGSNSLNSILGGVDQIQLSLLLQLCDSVALLVLILYTWDVKTIFLVIYIMKSKHLPNSSLFNGVMIKHIKLQSYFTLV